MTILRTIRYCIGIFVFTALVSFAGATYAQTQIEQSALNKFITDDTSEFASSAALYAQEEWEIVNYLVELKQYIVSFELSDRPEIQEVLAFIDGEILWFESHINTLLESGSTATLAQAQERYAQYPEYTEWIDDMLKLAILRTSYSQIESIHDYLTTEVQAPVYQGNYLEAVDSELARAEEHLNTAEYLFSIFPGVTETYYSDIQTELREAIGAQSHAYSMLNAMKPLSDTN